ncbi:hypothetical protein KFK09_011461 [Dendrobium nobile]|uniref:Chromo domain-containing protein n=1 Tax=Dendrobium nobile TaxID=94219 RepID=A0A8T3BFU9_DENNO|nr:hypothetical protein KFK09_011461 [Dendrobium nobile]
MTPFKVLYGRDPPHLVHYNHSSTPVSAVDQHLKERDQVLEELKRHLLRAQQLMKKQADGKRRDIQFAVGDKVYLKLRPYRQRTMAQRRNGKLAASQNTPRFSCLTVEESGGEHAVSPELPSTLREDMKVTLEPLVAERVRINEKGEREVKIRWSGLPDYEATWEPQERIAEQFPAFHLEDKVINILCIQKIKWVGKKTKEIDSLVFKVWYSSGSHTRNGVVSVDGAQGRLPVGMHVRMVVIVFGGMPNASTTAKVVNSICVLSVSERIASCDGTIHIWNGQSGKLITAYSESSVNFAHHVAATTAKVTAEQVNMLTPYSLSGGLLSNAFSGNLYTCMHHLESNHKLIAGMGNGSIRFVDVL